MLHPSNLILLQPRPAKYHLVSESNHCSVCTILMISILSLIFLNTLSLDFWDTPYDLSSLSVSSMEFGSLSIYFLSLLPHIILKFPQVTGHPLRKPLCYRRQVGVPTPAHWERSLRDSKGLIHVPDSDKDRLSSPHLHCDRQDSKYQPPWFRLRSTSLLLYSLISSTPTKAEANICHHFI